MKVLLRRLPLFKSFSLFAFCATGYRLEVPTPAQLILPFFPCCREGGVCATGATAEADSQSRKYQQFLLISYHYPFPCCLVVLMSCQFLAWQRKSLFVLNM